MNGILIVNLIMGLWLAHVAGRERRRHNRRDARMVSIFSYAMLAISAATVARVYLYGW